MPEPEIGIVRTRIVAGRFGCGSIRGARRHCRDQRGRKQQGKNL